MRCLRLTVAAAIAVGCLVASSSAGTISFGTGVNAFTMDFTQIGNAGNAADTTPSGYVGGGLGTGNTYFYGAVGYDYSIATYEVSQGMIDAANAGGGLGITMDFQSPAYTGDDFPAGGITWFEAATFANWLNTDKGYDPAYKYNSGTGMFELWAPGDAGYDASNEYRNSNAKFFIPNSDEWYKAAYYDPNTASYFDYTTGSDTVPTAVAGGTAADTAVFRDANFSAQGPALIYDAGALSAYGTMAQGGNVIEWTEGAPDGSFDINAKRPLRGTGWSDGANLIKSDLDYDGASPGATNGSQNVGFRIATTLAPEVPEPSALLLTMLGAGLAAARRRTV